MDAPSGILFEEESYAIRGAVFEVYSHLGAGFAEPVYQEALEMELALRGIPFEAPIPMATSLFCIAVTPATEAASPSAFPPSMLPSDLECVCSHRRQGH